MARGIFDQEQATGIVNPGIRLSEDAKRNRREVRRRMARGRKFQFDPDPMATSAVSRASSASKGERVSPKSPPARGGTRRGGVLSAPADPEAGMSWRERLQPVNRLNSSPVSARPQSPEPPLSAAKTNSAQDAAAGGPMTGIYADDGRTAKPGAEQPYLNRYNTGTTQQRAGVLRRIWDQGGVPVIGSGTASAPRADFGGRGGVLARQAEAQRHDYLMRSGQLPYRASIDTGMRPGTRGAAEHAAELAGHSNQSGVYGPSGRQDARDVQAAMRQRGGLFAGRTRTLPNRRDRLTQDAIAIERAKNEGTVEAARINRDTALTDREAAREFQAGEKASDREFRGGIFAQEQAATDRRRQEDFEREDARAAALMQPPKMEVVDGIPMMRQPNGDRTPIPEPVVDRSIRMQRVMRSMQAPDGLGNIDMIEAFMDNANQRNPKRRVLPVYNHATGTYGWASERDVTKPKMIPGTKIPVLQPLSSYDEAAYNALVQWIDSAQVESEA